MSTTKMEKIIELKNVWKTYKMGEISLDVLKGIDLDIFQGEFIAILGPSGSGKSTLMNQVGVLDTPSKGRIYLNNHNIDKYTESQLAQIRGRTIGFVFQQFNLIPTLTALENVTLPSIFQNVPEEERIKRATQLLTKVGLGDRLHHKPTELSGGQQQRVAIARSLINNPEIILADEPTGNLDFNNAKQIFNIIFNLKNNNRIIIFATHNRYFANMADCKIQMINGKIKFTNARID